ncbi:LysE family translocator [Salinisphaera sp. USBA-960]|nr:LysE family translocator [Salifodinibacter halophilus]NNC27212.1 LysE family translocator [Salifodinibacter halophilus]
MMSLGWFISVSLFAVSMTGTPGPNNVILTASGARYGYRRTLPAIFGILLGGLVLNMGLALGLGALFQAFPLAHRVLQVVGATYLLYLAWKIASAPPPGLSSDAEERPLTLWQMAFFQFANPKVWVMGLTLVATFMPAHGVLWLNALGLAMLMEVIAFPCVSFWAAFGQAIARWLVTDRAWRIFNVTMGLATAACVGFIVVD